MIISPKSLCMIAVVTLATVTTVSSAWAEGLASHRAAYNVGLAWARDGVGIENATGQVAYGVEKSCDGWILAQTGTMNLHLPTGAVAAQTLHYSSWEADDSTRYRFSVAAEGGDAEIILGNAEIQPGADGWVRFSRPEPLDVKLPAGTLFPVQHTKFLIERARAGKPQAESYIFEGTEVGDVKLVVAFINPLGEAAKAVMKKVGGPLLNRPGWSFRLAYFDPQDQTGEPLYEVEADMLDNGIAPRWVLDYGDYAIEMDITKIESLPKPDCG